MKRIMKTVVGLLTLTSSFASSMALANDAQNPCNEEIVKESVLKMITSPREGVTQTISDIKMSGVTRRSKGFEASVFQVLFSYHQKADFGYAARESDMIGIYVVNAQSCEVTLAMAESVNPL